MEPVCDAQRLREPACDAQTATGTLRKLITSGFGENSVNYAVFSAKYIEILYSDIKITTKWKNLKTASAHEESTDLILLVIKKPYKSGETIPVSLPREWIQEIKRMIMVYSTHGLFLTCT
jgi:hypothetical protein